MSWNSNAPMELLSHMPPKLSKANLETIQKVIDNDKFICSSMLARDLCGEYAPFCALCDKSMATPCAVAYIRMKQAEGIKLEIAVADDDLSAHDNNTEKNPAETDAPEAFGAPQDVEAETVTETVQAPTEQPQEEAEAQATYNESNASTEEEGIAEEYSEPMPEKKIIRIAVAKRKK